MIERKYNSRGAFKILNINFKTKVKANMKRTTERADLEKKQVPEYISGCR
jgi:hypothetical protein